MNARNNLESAIKNFGNIHPKNGIIEVIVQIANFLLELNLDRALKKEEDISTNKDPWINLKDFCNSLVLDGKPILYPHDIGNYLRKDEEYFKGCFKQVGGKRKFYILREKLLEKLKNYDVKGSSLKYEIRNFLKQQEDKTCQPTQQQ